MRIIVVAVLATVAVLAMVGVLLVFVFSQLTEDREDASARRTDRSTREDNPREGSVPEVAQELRLVAIVPSPRIVRLDGPGETERLTVQGYYSDRGVGDLDDGSGATVSYSSSDPSVAEVDTRGFVTGLSAGGADIIVTYGDLVATVPVFVWGTMKAVPPIDPERLLEVSEDGSAIVLNRVMVELEPGRDAHDADEVATGIGGQVVFEYRTFRGYLVEFDGRTDEDLREALVILKEDSRVASAYPDAVSPVNDGDENQIETLLFDTRQPLAYLDAGMEDAWRTMSLIDNLDPVTVAVIDTGFAFPLGDTTADMVLRTEFDYDRIEVRDAVFLAEDGDVPHDVEHAFHGVAVASVLVARNNRRDQDMEPEVPEESFSGVITSVDDLEYGLTIYKAGAEGFFGLGGLAINDAAVIAALEDIWQFHDQVDVVNLSLGGSCKWHEYFCNQRLDGFRARLLELMGGMPDVIFVAGAGNSAEAADKVVPAQLSLVLPNVITVGGTLSQTYPTPDNVRWEGSNFGPAITLGAPGEGVLVVDLEYRDGYGNHDGTSFSAPMVAGTVALLRALDPELEPAEIRRLVVESGEPRPVCTSDENPCAAEDQGIWSILDAGEAVSALLWPSVDAEIDLPVGHVIEGTVDKHVELTIPVVNTGARAWNFHLAGEARLDSENKELTYKIDPVQNVVPAGKSHPFKLGFSLDQAGEWTAELKLYRNPELTSSPDSESLRIQVAAGAVSAQAEQPIPPVTHTPEPPPAAAVGNILLSDARDRAILVELYVETDGDNWRDNYAWLTDAPIGEWVGVTTDADGRVTELHLGDNQLSWAIPPELGNLANLEVLDLSSNGLVGEIPPELGDLTNLGWLDLSGNGLASQIPATLASLGQLRGLSLHDNQLSGNIPGFLGNLTELKELYLHTNRLIGCVPNELSKIPDNDLHRLELPYCDRQGETRLAPVPTPTPSTDLAATIEAAVAAAIPTPTPGLPIIGVIYDFNIRLYQGQGRIGTNQTSVSDLRGKPTILNFWGGLCSPCRYEMQDIQAFAEAYGNRVQVIGVDIGPFFDLGDRSDALNLLNELSLTYQVGYTDDANLVDELDLLGLPTTLFINENGELYRKWTGVLNQEVLNRITDEMLSQ